MIYSDHFIEKRFEKSAILKEEIIQDKYSEKQLKRIYFDSAKKINRILINHKPKKYQEKHFIENKKIMLSFLDICIKENLHGLSFKQKVELKEKYINKVANRLTFLGVRTTDYVVFFIAAGLVLDFVLITINFATFYFYIPVLTIIIVYNQISGIIKAKKNGLLLR